jgi:Ferritin-like
MNMSALDGIKQQLQSAIELEFSTLPLYLSSMFSLEVQNYTVYNILRSVAMEEMVHMAIAANILSALGGTPSIRNIQISYPTKGLPGGAEPDLVIGLAQFSKAQLKQFMRIERPYFLVGRRESSEQYSTIGSFYNGIKEALRQNRDDVRAAVMQATDPNNRTSSRQVPDSIGLPKFNYDKNIDPAEMLCSGIDEIIDQGEGSQAPSIVTNSQFEYEESHYAKFASLYYGRAYQHPEHITNLTAENEPEFFKGPAIGWPGVVNILAVPSDGYAKILALDPNGPDSATGTNVMAQLGAFDAAFSNMLTTLDLTWNPTSQGSWNAISPAASKMINYPVFQNTAHLQESIGGLGTAVHGMMDFRVFTSFNINRQQIPDDIIQRLPSLYPDEFEHIAKYTNLSMPVFYGPRFINLNK